MVDIYFMGAYDFIYFDMCDMCHVVHMSDMFGVAAMLDIMHMCPRFLFYDFHLDIIIFFRGNLTNIHFGT